MAQVSFSSLFLKGVQQLQQDRLLLEVMQHVMLQCSFSGTDSL